MTGILEGKVLLLTGAAGGIGKECALLAGREGASVVINDVGGSVTGSGTSVGPAESVAAQVRAAGGQAVANAENVTSLVGVQRMVQQALDTFGGLHGVVNPAGILRDSMFHKMAEEDWNAVLDVHLRGAYNVSRATVEHFRKQGEGSYVHFTSTSGLIGNIAQANYAAAKMGVVGLSRILALEGALKNVRSNVIAPFAWTRMIATIPVTDEASAARVKRMQDGMRSDQVAQLCIALASPESKDVSGQIFVVRGNEVMLLSQPRPVKSLARLEGWTPRSLLDHALPAMKGSFTDLGVSSSVFPYDPV